MDFKKVIRLSFIVSMGLTVSAFAQIEKVVDLNEVNGKNFGFTIEGEAAGDKFGRATLFADINGDGYDDLIVNAIDKNITGNSKGMVYALFGGQDLPTSKPDLSALDGSNGFVVMGEFATGSFGARMASGDINGDNYDDLIFADPGASPYGRPSTAAVYVLFGKASWSDTLKVADFDGSDGFKIYGGRYEDPEYVASGDLNDDGFDEIIIGSDYSNEPKGQEEGSTTIIYGKSSGFPDLISTLESGYSSHGAKLVGSLKEDRFGHGLATGDFNNDGKTDLFASAPFYHRNFGEKGRIYVVLGNDTTYTGSRFVTNLTDETKGFILSETSSGCCQYAGQELKAGDTNGDGFDDLIIGIPNFYAGSSLGRTGRVVVYRGNLNTDHDSFGSTNDTYYAAINGITENDKTGYSLEVADINLDGNDDILIGAYNAKLDGTNRTGAVYVVYGPVLTDIDLKDLTKEQGFVLRGDLLSRSGINISTGDMNNDGIPEIAIGSYHNSPNGAQSGEVQVITNIASQTIQGDEGFRMLSSPSKGTVFNKMLEPYWTQGFTNSDAESGADPNVWTWDWENQEWDGFTNQDTDVFTAGNGFLMYQFSNDDNSGAAEGFPKEIKTVGSLFPSLDDAVEPNENSITAVSELPDQNYFLFGNPFTFTLDWDAGSGWSKTNIAETIQVWSDSANQWYDWNGMTGSKPDSGLIAPFQSVFIQADGGEGEMTLTTDAEADTSVTYLKQIKHSYFENLNFSVSNNEHQSFFNVNFHQHGIIGKDRFDALLLTPLSSGYISAGVFDKENNSRYSITSLPDSAYTELELPLFFEAVNSSSTASLTLEEIKGDFVNLELWDKVKNTGIELVPEMPIQIEIRSDNEISMKSQNPGGIHSVRNLQNGSTGSRYSLLITKVYSTSNEVEQIKEFKLYQNYPNPFNPATNITFSLPENEVVTLDVYDVMGRHVASLVNGNLESGNHTIRFNAKGLSTGLYFYKLKTGHSVIVKKMLLIK